MKKQNEIVLRTKQDLETYRNQLIRLNQSDLAKVYIQANQGIRLFMISAYSLLCFLGGLWFYHHNNANNEKHLTHLQGQVSEILNKQEYSEQMQIDYQQNLSALIMQLKDKVQNSNLKGNELKEHLVKLERLQEAQAYVSPVSYTQQRAPANADEEFSLSMQHQKMAKQLSDKHKVQRQQFLTRNDVSTSEGLRAWKEFTNDQLKEKRTLNRVIYNERKTFKN